MDAIHRQLDNGIELAVVHLPERHAVAVEIRNLVGLVDEPTDKLGLAHLVEQALDKGTAFHDGRGLSDAFDEIGASTSSWCGREATGFISLCLPEYFDRNVELHAEFLRTPTFPQESCEIAVELARQELLTLEDDAQALADKLIGRQAYGPLHGRHVAGERETLAGITRRDFVDFWNKNFCAGRMIVSVAGPLEPQFVIDAFNHRFAEFGDRTMAHREPIPIEFSATVTHHQKDTEQEQIAMAMPGVPVRHQDYPAEKILVGVLSGGMSARLFTEVREKQGLVYWVQAWQENPRSGGMIFVGASTTPERCDKTYETLLAELDRVGRDVTDEEVERAKTGLVVRSDVRSDLTRWRCTEQADDLMHYGRPKPLSEKLARYNAVTVDDVKDYAARRLTNGGLSVVTLGPRALHESDSTR
jgi:predicted Zn-dependent peptidase